MKIGYSQAQWFDRNPLSLAFAYHETVGPHPLTERWTYTVPVGRKALIGSSSCTIAPTVAPTTPGDTSVDIRIDPLASAEASVLLAHYNSSLLSIPSYNVGAGIILLNAGDIIRATTEDLAIDGTNHLFVGCAISEFDG